MFLTNKRAKPTIEKTNNETINDSVESFNQQNTDKVTIALGKSSTFYTMLLFHKALCEYVFNDNFGFLLCNDPYFRERTFDQLVRFMAERVYVMVDQLCGLKEGG